MTIENPGLMLPLILLVMLAGLGYCAYVIWRFIGRLGKTKDEQPKRKLKEKPIAKPRKESPFRRLADWLSEPAAKPAEKPPAEAAAPTREFGPVVEPDHVVPAGDAVEVLRVLRVGSVGELVVQVEGRCYRSLLEIKDGATGRRVLLAIRELEGFVGPAGKRALPELHRMSGPTAAAANEEPSLSADQRQFLEQMQAPSTEGAEPEEKMTVGRFWRQGLIPSQRKKIDAVDTGATFVAEIEDLIQLRLVDKAELAGRVIHFSSAPNGDLQIEVDGQFYGGIDAIPDPTVVSFIRSCIQAWENR